MGLPTRPMLGLTLLALVIPMGCVNDYHPEYSPRTIYSYRQTVSYPTTVILNVAPGPPVALRSSTPKAGGVQNRPVAPYDGAHDLGSKMREEVPRVETGRDSAPRQRLPDEPLLPRLHEDESVGASVATLDLAATRAKCHAGDAESCRQLPGVHINGNVQLFGHVVIFGDVFVNDSLASAERGKDP
jgi:hypothetical protein